MSDSLAKTIIESCTYGFEHKFVLVLAASCADGRGVFHLPALIRLTGMCGMGGDHTGRIINDLVSYGDMGHREGGLMCLTPAP